MRKHVSTLRKQRQVLLANHESSLGVRQPMISLRQIIAIMPREMARCNETILKT